jgi:hypothetical protein
LSPTNLDPILNRLYSAHAQLVRAAHLAESRSDQSLADDLYLHAQELSRMLAALEKGKTRAPLSAVDRAYLYPSLFDGGRPSS